MNNAEYINDYVDVIMEYLDTMSTSEFIEKQPNRTFLIQSGFRAITHVFHIHYASTGDSEGAFYNSQKAYIFYLEYLEQIEQTNMSHDLNHSDAILFVYNKTISKHTFRQTTVHTIDETIAKCVEKMMWFDNEYIYQCKITKQSMIDIIENRSKLFDYIDIAQRRIMDHDEYMLFLTEIQAPVKKQIKWEEASLYIIREWDIHSKLPMKEWCKWLKKPVSSHNIPT